MPDADRFHCRECAFGNRARANFTEIRGQLWTPECLAAKLAAEATRQTLARPAPPAPPTVADTAGLVVAEIPRVA